MCILQLCPASAAQNPEETDQESDAQERQNHRSHALNVPHRSIHLFCLYHCDQRPVLHSHRHLINIILFVIIMNGKAAAPGELQIVPKPFKLPFVRKNMLLFQIIRKIADGILDFRFGCQRQDDFAICIDHKAIAAASIRVGGQHLLQHGIVVRHPDRRIRNSIHRNRVTRNGKHDSADP